MAVTTKQQFVLEVWKMDEDFDILTLSETNTYDTQDELDKSVKVLQLDDEYDDATIVSYERTVNVHTRD